MSLPIPAAYSLDSYIQTVNRYPMLSLEDEQRLARAWHDQQDVDAARQLVVSHLRVVVSVARHYVGYGLPQGKNLTYAYSELTVPVGQDPVGSYFMANGFAEGYFGIQVNSPTERRVLFSVWSPFSTDNPREIPADQRVVTIAKGPETRAQDFGGEGSGGQSFLLYPWTAGTTYKFLTEVKPDGQGSTTYTAWFGEAGKPDWRLVAAFRRPRTDTHLRGFHSFLENFNPEFGHLERLGRHSRQWVRDTDGQWHEITEARFTGDATAGGGHRLDYAGGVQGDSFFLRNGGFFSDHVTLNTRLRRPPGASQAPAIDFDRLPR
ncbi:MAG: DUF3472 domain-containing protein [Akkermansiaceae bacterium]|nr:DUF3472 domain-containing protein [Akkermansiaceae bacterium]